MDLRPYQLEALKAIIDAEKRGVTRQLVIMATGLGKTVLMGGLLKEKGLPRTFGFMHREELLHQSRETILKLNPDARIAIEKGMTRSDPAVDQVVLASIQTIGRRDGRRLSAFPKEWPGVVWIDEAHHSPADSYLQVLDHFGLYGEKPRRDSLLLGTTATPDRFDKLGYGNIFDDVVYRYGLREAIRDKWLADIHAHRIGTDLDLSHVAVRHGDFVEKDLVAEILRSAMDETAIQVWGQKCRGRRSLFFCVNHVHATHVENLLKAAGAKVGTIVDGTKPEERRAILGFFRAGEIDAVINVQVLTEGFDAPEVECVHVLRPTKSRGLYTQIIGRGLRKSGTKEFLDLFDYTKNIHDVCSVGRIFGLPDSWELEGQSISKEADTVEEAQAELGLRIDTLKNVAQLFAQLMDKRVQLVTRTLIDSGLPSQLAWVRPSSEQERWVISWRNETKEQARRVPSRLQKDFSRYGLWGSTERIEIFKNELGNFEARWNGIFEDGRMQTKWLDADPSVYKLVERMEDRIAGRRFHRIKALLKEAPWRRKPITGSQREMLVKKGVPEWVVPKLLMGDAYNLSNVPEAMLRKWFEGISEPKNDGP